MRRGMLQRPGLLLFAAAGVVTPGVAAPEAADGTGTSRITEEIVVTGSRIKRRDFMSPSPLASIDRDTIVFTGQPSLEETLNQMPQVVPDFGRTSNNPGDGTARVNLRGLGAGRTLVLLNGRRLAPSGVGSSVDVNNLPQVLVDRIEIITGGATTVYGSDAVAGVVNFITREDFTGIGIDASVNVTEESDAEVVNASVAWGFDLMDGGGHVTIYADYLEREALLAGARDLTRVALANVDSDGTLVESGSPLTPSGVIFVPSVDFGTGQSWVTFDESGNPRQFLDPQDRYNFQPVNYLQTPLMRQSVGAMGSIGLGAADLELYFETAFAHNEAVQQLAPIPAATFAEVSTRSPFLSPEAQRFFADHYEVAPGLSHVAVGRRLVEVGPRVIENKRDYWRTVVGLRGGLGGGWEIDGWLTYTQASEREFLRNDASASRFVQGLLVDPMTGECANPSGGCVPVDVFGAGRLSVEAADFLRIDNIENETERTQILASVFVRGALIEGWAGPVDAAIGLEWRRDDTNFQADDVLFTGDTLAYRAAAPVVGREDVAELYAEALIPLARDTNWAEYAALEVGGRYSNYDHAGGVWTWKFGGEWQLTEAIRFRGMRQRSVRAPNNQELFTEPFSEMAGFFLGDDDPCSASADPVGSGNADKCAMQGLPEDRLGVFEATGVPIVAVRGGNPDLDPEVAESWTLGAVLTPTWLPDWTIAVDLFEIEVKDSIGAIDAFTICFDAQNTQNLFCQNLRRDLVSGNVIEILEPFSNRGSIATRGLDAQLNYETGLPRWLEFSGHAASLTLDLTWSHVLNYRWQQNPATRIIECAGYFGSFCSFGVDLAAFSTVPDDRVLTTLHYASGPLSVHLSWRWIDGTRNSDAKRAAFFQEPEPMLAIPKIGSTHYLDLGFGYRPREQIGIRFGIENLTDRRPPNMADAAQDNNTDAGLFDVFGRAYYLSLTANLFSAERPAQQ